MSALAPFDTVRAARGMVASVDSLASAAGLDALRRRGSAVDAAIAANAVLAVTLPNQCGIGGDLFALVFSADSDVKCLVAAGRAGSGADPEALRAAGHAAMPADSPHSVTVPGCVDGWVALHERHGRLPLADLLEPAIRYAEEGFPVSAFAAHAITKRAATTQAAVEMTRGRVLAAGDIVVRPGIGRVLRALASEGRSGVYEGEFGAEVTEATEGILRPEDLASPQAEWSEPLALDVWGARVWTPLPPSQGYLTLGAAWIAEANGLPGDPEDPAWAHALVEAMRQAAVDRPERLYDGADGHALLARERLAPRAAAIDPTRAADLRDSYRAGGTTYLCVVDEDGMAISLIQSNCMSFGSGIVTNDTGIWLHNRGVGFSLRPGRPGELGPGRRPAHTLAPALVTDHAGRLRAVLGTRGGDSQPQIVLQLLARLLADDADPAEALAAGRFILRGGHDESAFNTWGFAGEVRVNVEGQVAAAWAPGLEDRGHIVEVAPPFAHPFGHAQLIELRDGTLLGAADPRATSGSAIGY